MLASLPTCLRFNKRHQRLVFLSLNLMIFIFLVHFRISFLPGVKKQPSSHYNTSSPYYVSQFGGSSYAGRIALQGRDVPASFFFWYFPAQKLTREARQVPLIFWLQG